MTYDYTIIGNNTKIIKDIIEGKDNFTDKIKSAKNPMIIIGESALELSSGQFILFVLSNNSSLPAAHQCFSSFRF